MSRCRAVAATRRKPRVNVFEELQVVTCIETRPGCADQRRAPFRCGAALPLPPLRLLFAAWLILAAFVANYSVITLSVHLSYRPIDVRPVCRPLSGLRFVLAWIAHGFLSDRIKVLVSAVAAGPDRPGERLRPIARSRLQVSGTSCRIARWTKVECGTFARDDCQGTGSHGEEAKAKIFAQRRLGR